MRGEDPMQYQSPEESLILITGGSGYIGLSVIGGLLASRYRVRAIARSDVARERLEKAYRGRIETLSGDLTDVESLVNALHGVAAVVHLAARKADEPDSHSVNVGGAVNLAAACGFVGVRRVINISTLAANLPQRGLYGETKAEADKVLHEAGLEVTTIRLSLVYSKGPGGAFGQIVHMVRRLPVVPIIGSGGGKFWPIHVDDVSPIVSRCLEQGTRFGRIYEVGGPDGVSLAELVGMIAATLGLSRAVLPIPVPLAMALAKVTSRILARPPITVSNVIGAVQEPRFDSAPALKELGYRARPLREGLREALCGDSGGPN